MMHFCAVTNGSFVRGAREALYRCDCSGLLNAVHVRTNQCVPRRRRQASPSLAALQVLASALQPLALASKFASAVRYRPY